MGGKEVCVITNTISNLIIYLLIKSIFGTFFVYFCLGATPSSALGIFLALYSEYHWGTGELEGGQGGLYEI